MNELQRMAYLEAMGIEAYVSRRQLPGAAPSRRLVVVTGAGRPAPGRPAPGRPAPGRPAIPPQEAAAVRLPPAPAGCGGGRPAGAPVAAAAPASPGPRVPAAVGDAAGEAGAVPRFSLAVVIAGGWLWLEALPDGPLSRDQVQLVSAMAAALARYQGGPVEHTGAGPELSRFDWPMHDNRQLDRSESAARASLAAFVARRLEQHGCRGVIQLGQACHAWLAQGELACPLLRLSHASAELLSEPALKRSLWRELRSAVPGG